MRTLWQDLRYCARMLLKKPCLTLISMLTLCLGISANTALFSIIKPTLLRPLPYPESETSLNDKNTTRRNYANPVARPALRRANVI